MATITVNKKTFETQAIVFDKDGTLIDFFHLWKKRTQLCVERLISKVDGQGGDNHLRYSLYSSLGYDFERDTFDGDGPLATASTTTLSAIATAVLYQHGIPWLEAEQLTQKIFTTCMSKTPDLGDLQPIGDIKTLFNHLSEANILISIVTSDDRDSTIATLEALGIEEMINFLVCGDDDIPNKPSPIAVRMIQEYFDIETSKIMVVGDTIADMIMGTRAGVGCRVGVLRGAGDRKALESYSDVLINSIDDIQV